VVWLLFCIAYIGIEIELHCGDMPFSMDVLTVFPGAQKCRRATFYLKNLDILVAHLPNIKE